MARLWELAEKDMPEEEDFATRYTKIHLDLLHETLIDFFQEFMPTGSRYEDIYIVVEFLSEILKISLQSRFILTGNRVFRQVIGIPMRII